MISITITGDNAGEIAKNISDLDARLNGAKPDAPEAVKPAKSVRDDDPVDEAEETDDESGPTAEDVRKAVGAAAKAGNRDQVKDVLKKYKAKNVTSLKKEDYQSVIDDLELL